MEHEYMPTRARSPLIGALMQLAPSMVSVLIHEAQLLIRGQPLFGQISSSGNVNAATATLVSNQLGAALAAGGLGIASPLICQYVRDWLMRYDSPPSRRVNLSNQLESELRSLEAEINQKMGQVLWRLQPVGETLEEIRLYVKEPAAQWSEEKRLNAEEWYRRGLVTEAIDALHLAISPEYNPVNFAAYHLLGHIFLYEQHAYEEALDCFQKAAHYAERAYGKPLEAAENHLLGAVAAFLANQLGTALNQCNEALRLDPELLEAHYLKAKCLARLNECSAALAALEPAANTFYSFACRDSDLIGISEIKSLLESIMEAHVTEVIGFDLGHGDTAIAKTLLNSNLNNIDILEPFGFEKQVTAIGTDSVGKIFVGDQAVTFKSVTRLNIEVKPRVNDLANYPAQILKDFIKTYYDELRNKGSVQGGEFSYFVVGCPSGWNLDDREKYAQLLKIDEIPLLSIVSESRAAFVHASDSGKLTQKHLLFSEVLVIDIGSSTTDFTVVKNKREEVKDFGANKLGASLIDKSLFVLSLQSEDNAARREEIEEAFRQNSSLKERCLFACRCAKEIYFSQDVYEQNPTERVEKYDVPIDRKKGLSFLPIVNAPSIEEALNMPQVELEGKSWKQAFIDQIQAVKQQLEEEGTRVSILLLTGGASRMSFIRKLCSETFEIHKDEVIIDTKPEYTIAKGLAGVGRWDILSERFKQEVEDLIESGEVKEIVQSHIPKLIDLLVEPLSNEVLTIVEEHLKSWRRREIKTFAEVDSSVNEALKLWIRSNEAKHLIGSVSKKWLQDESLLEDLNKKTQPICRKYRIDESDLGLQTNLDPDIENPFVSLADAIGIEEFTRLTEEITQNLSDLIGGVGAAVAMIAVIFNAWWTAIIAFLASLITPKFMEKMGDAINNQFERSKEDLIKYLRQRDLLPPIREGILSDQRIKELRESKKLELMKDLKQKMQGEQFFEDVVQNVTETLEAALFERADLVAVLIK